MPLFFRLPGDAGAPNQVVWWVAPVRSLAFTRSTPAAVLRAEGEPLEGATGVTAGVSSACATLADGGVVCWGANPTGELGDGTTVDHFHAAPVTDLDDAGAFVEVSTTKSHTCARSDGAVWCWGYQGDGRLGDGCDVGCDAARPTAQPIAYETAAFDGGTAVTAGAFNTCVVYTPAHREAICIEPYTCVPGRFGEEARWPLEGALAILPPGESVRLVTSIELRPQ